jgi:hypothetical protein
LTARAYASVFIAKRQAGIDFSRECPLVKETKSHIIVTMVDSTERWFPNCPVLNNLVPTLSTNGHRWLTQKLTPDVKGIQDRQRLGLKQTYTPTNHPVESLSDLVRLHDVRTKWFHLQSTKTSRLSTVTRDTLPRSKMAYQLPSRLACACHTSVPTSYRGNNPLASFFSFRLPPLPNNPLAKPSPVMCMSEATSSGPLRPA